MREDLLRGHQAGRLSAHCTRDTSQTPLQSFRELSKYISLISKIAGKSKSMSNIGNKKRHDSSVLTRVPSGLTLPMTS